MKKNKNNNSVIIECNRIELTPTSFFGNFDEDNYVISWKAYGLIMKKIGVNSDKKTYSILPKNKRYAIRFPEGTFFTNKEGKDFVDIMLNRSNFAKANKIIGILYRQENKPCGVLTEEF